MGMIVAMVKKDLMLLFRDKFTVFFTFGFPLVYAGIFGSIFSVGGGGGSGLSVAVTDLDRSTHSTAFVQRMDEVSELQIEIMEELAAREATRKGRKVAYIILPEGFGDAYGSLFSGGTPEVIIGVDPSRQAEAGMLQGVMMKLGVERFENTFADTDSLLEQLDDSILAVEQDEEMPAEWQSLLREYLPQMRELAAADGLGGSGGSTGEEGGDDSFTSMLQPLALEFEDVAVSRDGPQNGHAITVPQAMYWAVMGVVMGFGVALVQEKALGTMTRLVAAPISRIQILGGKAAGCFFALLVVMAMLFTFARFVFGVPIENPVKLILAVLAVSVCFVGIMMFLAALGKTERGMGSLGWGVMMIFAMFGGAMVPLFIMPDWMRAVSDYSPVKWAILSFEGATWRGFTYQELALPLTIMLVLGVLLFLAGSRMMRLEE
jgi:ABC-2 type transport system permease protein